MQIIEHSDCQCQECRWEMPGRDRGIVLGSLFICEHCVREAYRKLTGEEKELDEALVAMKQTGGGVIKIVNGHIVHETNAKYPGLGE